MTAALILSTLAALALWARCHWLRTYATRAYENGLDDGARGERARQKAHIASTGLRRTSEPVAAEDTEIDLRWEADE